MKITILANRDVASNFALNRLLPALAAEHRLSIFLSSRVGGNTLAPKPLVQLKLFEQSLFNDLLFPALARSSVDGRLLSFEALAASVDAPLSVLNKINSNEGLKMLVASQPELVLSIRYGGILRETAIAVPRLGVLNLHSGLLPQYRGVMASFYAMLNGDSSLGTTLHFIRDAGIDTGDIVGNTQQLVQREHSYLWNVLQLYPAGVDLMCSAVAKLTAGLELPVSAQPEGGNYYSFPSEDQLHRFGELGLSLYDVQEIIDFAKYYLEP